MNEFIKSENVYLIWELLSEQNIIKNQPNKVKEQISYYVVNEICKFYNKKLKRTELTLVQMNKEYIKNIIYYVNTNYPNQINEIKIHKEPVTFKDIQEQRELEFNTKFNEIHNDFTNMVTLNKPKMPQFEDSMGDNPVSVNDIEERMKEMTMKRNYDLQTFETNNEKKNVSFENEKKEESVTDEFHIFLNNLDTNKEPDYDSNNDNNTIINNDNNNDIIDKNDNYNNNNSNNINDIANIIDTDTDTDTDNIDNSIFNLQKQINHMQDKIDSLETKLDLLLNKI
jgi:hypothetical protein